MASMQRQTAKPLLSNVRNAWCPLKQVISPQPRQAAEGDFKAAGPVDSDGIRIVGVPVAPLPQNLVSKAAIASQSERLRERHQMLVTIQFPSDFAVADFGKRQVLHPVKNLAWRTLSM